MSVAQLLDERGLIAMLHGQPIEQARQLRHARQAREERLLLVVLVPLDGAVDEGERLVERLSACGVRSSRPASPRAGGGNARASRRDRAACATSSTARVDSVEKRALRSTVTGEACCPPHESRRERNAPADGGRQCIQDSTVGGSRAMAASVGEGCGHEHAGGHGGWHRGHHGGDGGPWERRAALGRRRR